MHNEQALIREANNISNARRLQAGKVVLIPTNSMTTTPVAPKVAVRKTPAKAPTSVRRKSVVKKAPKRKAVATEQRSYRVRSGDTLWSIAKRFNLSVKELRKLNQLRGNTIRVGALLRLMWPRSGLDFPHEPTRPCAPSSSSSTDA